MPPSFRLLARMLLVALVIGTSLTVASTERITLSLVAVGTAGWIFVPVLQLLTGLLLIRGTSRDRLSVLERYFALHWPWSFWILATQASLLLSPWLRRQGLWMMVTAAVPLLWTVKLLIAFCREELRLDERRGRWRVGLHQSATYALVVAYVALAVALWPRVLAWLP